MNNNQEIRKAIFESGVKKYEIATALNITDSTFSRKLRKEFSKEEKEKILKIIEKLSR